MSKEDSPATPGCIPEPCNRMHAGNTAATEEEEARKYALAKDIESGEHFNFAMIDFLAGLRRGKERQAAEIEALKKERDQQQAWAIDFQRERDALQKQLEEAKANERFGWEAHEGAAKNYVETLSDLAAAREEVQRLKDGLEEYGAHNDLCRVWEGWAGVENHCTCGLSALLEPTPDPSKRGEGE